MKSFVVSHEQMVQQFFVEAGLEAGEITAMQLPVSAEVPIGLALDDPLFAEPFPEDELAEIIPLQTAFRKAVDEKYLSQREARILFARTAEDLTFSAIGAMYGLSSVQIRKIESLGRAKVRNRVVGQISEPLV